jgi:pimeloyl-ACP methyl ester carboxylesterase
MTLHQSSATQRSGFVRAHGANIYFEEQGRGRPLLLIHGGTLTGDSWKPWLPAFAEQYHVVVPDTRGHGRTDNSTGAPMSYRLLADDVAALVQALGLHKPLIFGYSDGGQIALEIGMRYPELPQALVVGGAWFKFSASYLAWVADALGEVQSPDVDCEQFAREHTEWAALLLELHGAERWRSLLTEVKRMWVTPLNYERDDFAQVLAPTLVLAGDRDELVPVEEAAEMARLLPKAELAIIPGADHGSFLSSKTALFQTPVLDFLRRHDASED